MLKRIRERYCALSLQAKASLWFLICAFMQKGISTLTTPIFTRLMNTEEYGRFGVFNSWLGIISVLVTLDLYYGVYGQGLVKFSADRAAFSSSMQGLIFTLCAGYTLIYTLFRQFFNELFHLSTVQMYAALLIIWNSAVFNLWSEEKRVEYRYKPIIGVSLLLSVVKPVLGIVLVLRAEDKVTARILGLVIVDTIICTALFLTQVRRGGRFCSKKYWVYAVGFNLPLLPHYLSGTVLNSTDRIMIENLTGSGNAGIYNLAYSVAMIMVIFNSSLMQTISPWMYQRIKDNQIKGIDRVAYSTLLLIGVLNILLILFAPEVVRIFAPPEYAEAIWVIPPVAMSVFFMYGYDLFAKFSFYYEKTVGIMAASAVSAALNILLNYLCIPVFGYVAAGYTTLICYMVYALAHYLIMRRACRECCGGEMPYRTGTLLLITAVFLAVGFLFTLTYTNNLLRWSLILLIAVLGIIFRNRIAAEIRAILSVRKRQS
ncbi:MAG: oligosaccharide flippase family protein [Oscillospiraceae bacterium]|nr:oligosaccharide flippase family protein [Oscillospiraceae bacterium]